ncbi:thioredoxin [Patescibacteria group bacterium]|nr:thioredoxin [Patescibacteria group bacterium]
MSKLKIDSQNFENEVINSEIPVMVDFWADWCMPCHMLDPVIEEIANEFEGKIKVGGLNVDENGDLSSKYSIMSIPAVLFFKDGKEVSRLIGVRGKEDFTAEIDKIT